jgi:hypothetical protein
VCFGALPAVLLLCACDSLLGAQEDQAKRAVAESLIDPSSAQFRNLSVQGSDVCGEVNARNKMGAYVGFTRFVVDTSTGTAYMQEDFDHSDLLSAEDLCSSSNEYMSYSTRLSGCERAIELRSAQAAQVEFQRRWDKSCGPIKAREVYQPTLAAPPDANAGPADGNESTESEEPIEAPDALEDGSEGPASNEAGQSTDPSDEITYGE